MIVRRFATVLCIGLLVLPGCSGNGLDGAASELEDVTDASISDEVEQGALDLAADVEEQMDTLTDEIQSSDAADDLRNAWNDIQTAVTGAIASMQADGAVPTEEIEEAVNEFQAVLDEAGDDIAPELETAWESLRSSIRDLTG